MFKSLDRYILKEIVAPFGVGLLVYTSTMLINHILMLSKVFVSKDATLATVLQILLYLLPDIFSFTIPLATLMGVLAGMSRMSSDSEIVALRTMGVSSYRILRPVMAFAVLAWLVTSVFIMFIAPEANFRKSRLYGELKYSQVVSNIKPGVFYFDMFDYTLFFRDIDQNGTQWRNVLLHSSSTVPGKDFLILAKSGRFHQDKTTHENSILLYDGVVHEFWYDKPERYSITSFRVWRERLKGIDRLAFSKRGITELRFPELAKRFRKSPQDLGVAIEFHTKFSQPFACLALALLGLAFGVSTRKGGKTSGFVISLIVVFVYYVLITAARNFILEKHISPLWGMWLPNLFLVVLGLLFFRYSIREKEIRWGRLWRAIGRLFRRRSAVAAGERKYVMVVRVVGLRLRLMKILDHYIAGKIVFIFLLTFLSLVMVFYIITFVELIDDVVENKVPFFMLLEYLFEFTPEIVHWVLPISLLTAVLLAFSLMSKTNETLAVQVSGISLYRLAMPALLLGLLFSAFALYNQEEVIPTSTVRANNILKVILRGNYQENQFHFQNWVAGRQGSIYYYMYYEKARQRFNYFNKLDFSPSFDLGGRTYAVNAQWRDSANLDLENSVRRNFRENIPSGFSVVPRQALAMTESRDYFLMNAEAAAEMNIRQLRRFIGEQKLKHGDTRQYEAQLYSKYAFPLGCLVMVLIAIPFSFMMGNRGAFFGVGIAILISMVFWGAVGVFNSLGLTGLLSPWLSAFAPFLLFGVASLILFLQIKT